MSYKSDKQYNDILEVKGVCKKYPLFELKDVSFSVPKGKIVGFIGRNGAGKTTTLKAIMNLISFQGGSVFIFGKDMKKDELEIKKDIGFSLSEINYYPDTHIKTITNVVKKFYENFDDDIYFTLKEKFNIDEKKKIRELSSGMKVKYQLLLSLSHQAKLLILDEPTSGLDPISRDEIVDIFLDFVSDGEKSILFSTHITSDLEKCADNLVYISSGNIIYEGSCNDLIDSYFLVCANCDEINEDLLQKFVSYKIHTNKLEGLVRREDSLSFGSKAETPTIEEVMVYLERAKK